MKKTVIGAVMAVLILFCVADAAVPDSVTSLSQNASVSIAAGDAENASINLEKGKPILSLSAGDWVEYRVVALHTAAFRFNIMASTKAEYPNAIEVIVNSGAVAAYTLSLSNTSGLVSSAATFDLSLFEGENTVKLRALSAIDASFESLSVEGLGSAGTVATLSLSPESDLTYGKTISFTCNATSEGKPAAGNIYFLVDGKKSGPVWTDFEGSSKFSTSSLTAGKHTVAAFYESAYGFTPAQSNAITFVVHKAVAQAPEEVHALPALYGQRLAEIALPENCRWKNPNQSVGNATSTPNTFAALYNPDPDNMEDLEISVPIKVSKRAITVKAVDKEKVIGQEDPALTIEIIEGELLTGDVIHGTLKYEGARVGTYDIVPKTAISNANYAITFQKGSMKILPDSAIESFMQSVDKAKGTPDTEAVETALALYKQRAGLKAWEQEGLPLSCQSAYESITSRAAQLNHNTTRGSIAADGLPWYAKLSILDNSSLMNRSETGDILSLVKISVTDIRNGRAYKPSPSKSFVVTLHGLEANGASELCLAHETHSGQIEYIAAKAVGENSYQFETKSFSTFAIASSKASFAGVDIKGLVMEARVLKSYLPFGCLAASAALCLAWRLNEQMRRMKRRKQPVLYAKPSSYKYMRS